MTAVWKVLLFLLKCLGILLLVILGLLLLIILLVLLAPVRYRGKLKKQEAPEEIIRADGLISWLNPFLRVRIRYEEKKLRYTVRLFGLCLLDSDKPKKEKKAKPKKAKKARKAKATKKKKKQTVEDVKTDTVAELTDTAELANVPESSVEESAELPETTQTMQSEDAEEASESSEKREGLFSKIKSVIHKIKAIPEKIKQKVRQCLNTLKLLWYKKEKVVAFFEDELHILALGKSWKAVKQLLGHILPGKIKGHLEFGTGDPESTGKALGALGVMYAAYGKGITIVPDFYEKRLVADIALKGRIRCGTVLLICLRLIRDKQVKRLYHNWKKLLKILKQKAE